MRCPIWHRYPTSPLAGACATATHGSGEGLGNLATVVSGLELVTASGELVTLTRDHDSTAFNGAVVGLGGLGVVTKMTLDLVPTFMMQQEVYKGLPLPTLYENFDAIMGSGYSVCLFTDWQQEQIDSAWVKRKLSGDQPISMPTDFFGARLASHEHVLEKADSDRILTPMSVPGPWYERLPHMWLKRPHGPGNELQTEYFVPRHHAVDAMRAVENLRTQFASIIQLTELRTVAADKLWMSPSYGQDTVGIHSIGIKIGWLCRTSYPSSKNNLPHSTRVPIGVSSLRCRRQIARPL